MVKIEKHIESLLHHYDCVIIPEFGGFITNEKPGFLDNTAGVFHPPFKQILFNKNLRNNDGLLANHIANQEEGINYYEANLLLNQFKDACFARLNNEGRVEIEKIGVLFFDVEKNIQFSQSSKNFLISSFGLSSKFLTPIPISKESKIVKAEVKKEIKVSRVDKIKLEDRPSVKAEPLKRKKSRKAVWITVITLPILISGLYFANQLGYFGESRIQLSSLNPFRPHEEAKFSPRAIAYQAITEELKNNEVLSKELISDPIAIVNERGKALSNEVIGEKKGGLENEEAILLKKYHVIGGCFSDKKNAEKFVQKWEEKGTDALIVDKKGDLYRVSISSFLNRSEANQFRDKLSSEEDQFTWILKK